MSADKIVAVIGILMALTLVLANSRVRRQPSGAKLWMAGAWVAIIVVAAFVFSGFIR